MTEVHYYMLCHTKPTKFHIGTFSLWHLLQLKGKTQLVKNFIFLLQLL